MCPPKIEAYQYGWVCPRCGTVHAPFVRDCGCPTPTITLSTVYGLGITDAEQEPR